MPARVSQEKSGIRLQPNGQTDCSVDRKFDEIVPPKPEEERDMCGDKLTMLELTSELLYYSGAGWLEAMQKWNVPKVGVVLNKFRIAVQRRFRS